MSTESSNKRVRTNSAHVAVAILSILLTSCLAGFFAWQANDNPNLTYYPYQWRANWIKAPFNGPTACYRKVLDLSEIPKTAYIAMAVDNFYEVKVNGTRVHRPFFQTNRFATWEQEQSLYTQIGYPRYDYSGRIYDIKSYLHQGRNVISVKVQSDEMTPMLALQGKIVGAHTINIQTDSSWKCFPHWDRVGETSWDQPNFNDYAWANAVDTGKRVDVPVDGPEEPFLEPPHGYFIAGNAPSDGAFIFQKTISAPTSDQTTWLRLSTLSDYDLVINGRLIYSTALIDRYRNGPLAVRGDVDALTRVEGAANLGSSYPTTKEKRFIDVLVLRNLFHAGDNTLSITLHQHPITEMKTTEDLWVDGVLDFDGKKQTIQTDKSWNVQVPGASSFAPVVVESAVTNATLVDALEDFGVKTDRGILGFIPGLMYSAVALFILLLCGVVNSLIPRPSGVPAPSFLYRIPAVVPASFLTFCALLHAVFSSSPQNIYFSSTSFAAATLWIAFALAIVGALLPLLGLLPNAFKKEELEERPAAGKAKAWIAALLLVAIVTVSAAFCYHGLGSQGYLADEYVSMVAAKGIVRHGVPLFDYTGIIYTRSSLFHYLLALFMLIGGGSNKLILGTLPILWHLATVVLAFVWVRQMKGRKAALLASALIAFSPYLIYFAREIRFYSQFAFLTTICFYFLWRTLQRPDKDIYKVATLLAFTAAYLSQQFAIGMLPAVLVVMVLSGQLKRWFRGWPLVTGLFAIAAMGLDAIAYFRYCQTDLPYIDSESVSPIAAHSDVLEVLPSMLLTGYERSQFALGLAYGIGAIWSFFGFFGSVKKRWLAMSDGWTWWSYMYLTSLLGIIVCDVIVSRPTSRYIVQMAPMVLITVACGTVEFCEGLPQLIGAWSGRYAAWLVRVGAFAGCVLIMLAGYRPMRTWHSDERVSIRDLTDCITYLKPRISSGDKVIFFTPEAALYELGHCDYMWRPKKGSIFKYIANDGQMRERNSAALVIDNVDKMRTVLENSNRVWLIVQTQNLAQMGKDANGELNLFVHDNFKVDYEPISMMVMEWDRSDGRFRSAVANHSYDANGF